MADEIEDFLKKYSPDVRECAQALRSVVTKALPEANEKLHVGWKSISYSLDGKMKTMICGICPHESHVNLQLSRATELDDAQGLLEGTGKGIRHIKIKAPADARRKAVKVLIQASRELVQSSL